MGSDGGKPAGAAGIGSVWGKRGWRRRGALQEGGSKRRREPGREASGARRREPGRKREASEALGRERLGLLPPPLRRVRMLRLGRLLAVLLRPPSEFSSSQALSPLPLPPSSQPFDQIWKPGLEQLLLVLLLPSDLGQATCKMGVS